ncbi:anthranilate synthase component I [Phytophthora nicotianae P10297]|uniref:anthranilate synthase n=4 Tax=Phytophthora nicotianae TaxID=4792 RepID=W2RGT3_PHYN3|nr:anthranilate synthase component I [Phytophthora nicotianae INRA-310]ETI56484.1 anthranilate synthase component I [Phytophthora nicotianae P1569]ETL49646.1 anthranilate synthase component I [Phytophthora nicotianae]ETP54307.1 anthranilate synthase component I [Phytophthora nicotianae P10297]KUF75719.1 anthranilate synthase component 1 [Phytophthora nicotianae]ETM02692.1 anthranilate synthase component I [Phytophthora nicotianae]
MSFQPQLERVAQLQQHHPDKNLVPVYLDAVADLDTPVSVLLKLREGQTHSFLLESVAPGEKIARYSFIGAGPLKVVSTGKGQTFEGDPLTNLEQEMKNFRTVTLPELNVPMTGGAVGYCGFDAIRHFEPKIAPYVEAQKDVLKVPESIYMFFDTVVIFDHVFHSLKIVSHVRLDTGDLAAAYKEATDKIMAVNAALEKPLVRPSSVAHASTPTTSKIDLEAASNVGKAGYMGFVDKLKEHIVDGDIFQAVPSQRLAVDLPKDVTPLDLYRQMRVINPSPYMFFLDMGEDFQIVGASPEMLVKVDHDRIVETHPIAGTRHRGANDEEDEALVKDLLSDKKERAEHIMLVDLGRNDVGRVAKPGSVRVERLMQIEKYSHVMHIVSVVKGDLREDRTVYDAYRAMFPAGTLSGAPKVRAMELICSLETERRGVYSGSVGYFSFSGFLDTAIAIRTMVVKDGKVYSQAGGGIVYDSDPQAEYMETVNKLGSAVKTLEKCAAHMAPTAQ